MAEAEKGRRWAAALVEQQNCSVEAVYGEAGIEGITPHNARHSYASTLQAEGIEVATVAKLAGHASPVTTLGVYSHALCGGEIAAEAVEKAYINWP